MEKCKQIAIGVCTYDVSSDACFNLHVYPILAHADMPAAKHLMELKGSNMFHPCCACEIYGVQGNGLPIYYVPLNQPRSPGAKTLEWDPHHLPMRSQEWYDAMMEDIASQTTKCACDNLCQYYGISHVSAICELPSMKLFKSFPHEWMHLVLENHAKKTFFICGKGPTKNSTCCMQISSFMFSNTKSESMMFALYHS